MIRSVFLGCGSYVPARVLTNAELARRVDTSDEWIVERTGIRERRIAADDERTSDLAVKAAEAALADAKVPVSDVDLVLLATATPDLTFPATATIVQAALGMVRGAAFDIQAVCSGFVYALSVADALIKAGQFRTALVIGAETFSRILDWTDRATCVLFGDGAGAVVLRAERGQGTSADRGLLGHKIYSDGRQRDLLYVDGGPSATKTVGHLRMEGREVFKHAVINTADVIEEVCRDAGVSTEAVDWIVPHQANQRILTATAKRLGLPEERVVSTIAKHGNTSAASVPLALDEAIRDGRIRKNQLVVFEAMGGGFTWGASLARW